MESFSKKASGIVAEHSQRKSGEGLDSRSQQKRYLAGALNALTGKLTWVEGESKDSELFVRLVFQLGWDYPTAKRVHLILDNYGIHKSQFTKMVVASCEGKVRLHFLPPYCPDEDQSSVFGWTYMRTSPAIINVQRSKS